MEFAERELRDRSTNNVRRRAASRQPDFFSIIDVEGFFELGDDRGSIRVMIVIVVLMMVVVGGDDGGGGGSSSSSSSSR